MPSYTYADEEEEEEEAKTQRTTCEQHTVYHLFGAYDLRCFGFDDLLTRLLIARFSASKWV